MAEDKPATEPDWAQQGAGLVLRYVDTVRDKTTRPALKGARVAVYGLVAALVGSVALIILTIGAFRLVDGKLPGRVWTTYLLFGGIFFLSGLVVFSKRRPKAAH